MSKKIRVPAKPQPASPPATADEWIGRPEHSESQGGAGEPLVRLTFDIPESLHRRIKINCAERGIKRMATELRRILEQHFPEPGNRGAAAP
jgi:hypothetical protein